MFSLQAIIALRGYHVYQETSWPNAKTNEEVKDAKSLLTENHSNTKCHQFLLED